MLEFAREGGDIAVPSTIQALLQARLDRLGADERAVIERGAVEGQVFHSSAVRELGPEAARSGVDQSLVGLVRKELIRPDEPMFAGDDAFRFRHLLIRDAAYESLPKETRADLHARFGDWIEGRRELVELDEIAGYHQEQAVLYLRELGRDDPELAARAGMHLGRAGTSALGRSDFHAACNLLERALVLLPAVVERDAAGFTLAEACMHAGRYDLMFELLGPLTRSTEPLIAAQARILEAHARIQADPHGAAAQARTVLDELLPQLEGRRDDGALARAWLLESMLAWLSSRAEPAARASRLALAHARRAGDQRLHGVAAYTLAAAAAWGPAPPAEQEALIRELETEHGDSPAARTGAEYVRTTYLMNRGELDAAREASERLLAAHLELGEEVLAATVGEERALIERWDGETAEALRVVEGARRRLLELGATSWGSTVTLHVAEVRYALGDVDAAERIAIEGEELGSPEDVVNFAIGRGLRARIAADRGERTAAEELAGDAVRYALLTDFPIIHGDAYSALAHVHKVAGRVDDERAALEQALAAYRRKEILPMVRLTEELLAATRG